MRDHHTVCFPRAAQRCAGHTKLPSLPAESRPAESRPQPGSEDDHLRLAKVDVLAQLGNGDIQSFVMRTRPVLAPPWGKQYPIADMRFTFAADTQPLPSGFTVR